MPPDAELQEVVDASAPSASAPSAPQLSRVTSAAGSSVSGRPPAPEQSGVSQSGLSGLYRVDYQVGAEGETVHALCAVPLI